MRHLFKIFSHLFHHNKPIGLIEGETIRFFASQQNDFTDRYMPIWQVNEQVLLSMQFRLCFLSG